MYLQFIKIAFLNTVRNFRRTLLTSFGIGLGMTSLILFEGYVSYTVQGLREQTIRTGLGHVRIYKKGYEEFKAIEPEKYLLSEKDLQGIQDLFEKDPHLLLRSQELKTYGLISNGKNSFPAIVYGSIAETANLINSGMTLLEGDFFSEDEPDGVNIGKGLAKLLGVKIGDYLTLMGTTTEGYINAVDVQMIGIVESGISEVDNRLIYANLEHIQRLYGSPESFSYLILMFDETKNVPGFVDALQKRLQEKPIELEYKTWLDLGEFYRKVKDYMGSIFFTFRMIILITVIFFINNTMIMSVMERFSELGTMRALGETRFGILRMILTESAFIGLFGGIIGIFLGWASATIINQMEFMMAAAPGMNKSFPLMFILTPEALLKALGLCTFTAFLSGFYPALKGCKLKIVDAIRHV